MTSKPASPFQKPGTEVEIFSKGDEGIRIWSVGKVIHGNHSHVMVEYTYCEQGTNPRVEFVSIDNLRPRPPLKPHHDFKSGDKVDTYNDKGSWLEGHITSTLSDGRSFVCYNDPNQKFLFPNEKLRAHHEWIDDHWGPPTQQPKKAEQELFRKGDWVEVSRDVDGYLETWFLAEVVEVRVQGKFKYLVRYKHLLDDNSPKYLEEEIDAQHIRPLAPNTRDGDAKLGLVGKVDTWHIGDCDAKYKLGDRVDAWSLSGWRYAKIIEVQNDNIYKVFLKGDEQEKDNFDPITLRRHYDWVDRKWEIASQGSSCSSDEEYGFAQI